MREPENVILAGFGPDDELPMVPMGNRILCRMRGGETKGGIVTPDTVFSSPRVAAWRVIAIGPEVTRVKIGDAISIDSGAYAKEKYNGIEFAWVREEFVLGILKPEPSLQSDTVIDPRELGGKKVSENGRYMEP